MSERSPAAEALVSRMLKFALGFTILAVLLMAASRLAQWLSLPIPGSILGMVLLLGLLACLSRLANTVQAASMPLLKHMMLFFIPSVAGVMEQFQALANGWLAFTVACIVGAALTLAVTALTLQFLLKRQGHSA